jgi:glycosyltransferase involved in cell wall biosynthesis
MKPEVIRHPTNMGKSAALKTGFTAANGADVIVALDTDGQHDPVEITKLTAPILIGRGRYGERQPVHGRQRQEHAHIQVGGADCAG